MNHLVRTPWGSVVLPGRPPWRNVEFWGTPPAHGRGGRPPLHSPILLAILAAAALLLAGCGISLGGENSSELFSELRVQGESVVGSEMTLEVTYEQRNPVAVDVSCFLVQPGRSRRLLGRDRLAPDPDTSVEPTPVAGSASFRFRVQTPGRYLALCNTPLDPDNFIKQEFRVR